MTFAPEPPGDKVKIEARFDKSEVPAFRRKPVDYDMLDRATEFLEALKLGIPLTEESLEAVGYLEDLCTQEAHRTTLSEVFNQQDSMKELNIEGVHRRYELRGETKRDTDNQDDH